MLGPTPNAAMYSSYTVLPARVQLCAIFQHISQTRQSDMFISLYNYNKG